MTTDKEIEDKVNARFALKQSAESARKNRIDPTTWMSHPEIQEFIKLRGLREDIALHIAEFVWTWQKNP